MVARMVEDVEGFIVSSAAALGAASAGPPPCSQLLVRYTILAVTHMQLHVHVVLTCMCVYTCM